MSEYIPILEECLAIAKDRGKFYGSAIENCNDASNIMKEAFNDDITPEQCCKVIIATKLARSRFKYKKDNYLDIINYFAILISLHENDIEYLHVSSEGRVGIGNAIGNAIRDEEAERGKKDSCCGESFGERCVRKVDEETRKDEREKSCSIFDMFLSEFLGKPKNIRYHTK